MEKKSVMKKITGSREALLAIVLIVLFVIITAINPSFLTPKSLMDMLKNNAVTMVMSLGMLCVMLVGGIDISIMSTLALSGMSIGMLLKYGHITSTLLAFIIAMAIGIACGLVVGLVISRANVPPIIATMGFMYIYRAMGYLVSHGGEWASAAALGDFKNFATSTFLGINKVIWVIIICYVVFFFFMKWTRTGRRIYAVGSNASAAQVSGINAKNINLLVYVIMGVLTAIAGLIVTTRLGSGQPSAGLNFEMDCITASVVGGTSMSGGRGKVMGTVVGVLLLTVLTNGMTLVGMNTYWQQVLKGVIIVVSVLADTRGAYSARTAHPFQRNGAPFRFKLSKAQQVD